MTLLVICVGRNLTIKPDVVVQQPALPAYRAPLFLALQEALDLSLLVVHSKVPNLANIRLDSLNTYETATRTLGKVHWDRGQLYASLMAAEVVVLHWNTRYLSLIPALLIARIRGLRTLLWGHGYSKNEKVWRFKLRNLVGSLADALIVYDEVTAARLRDSVKKPVYCALNAIDQGPIRRARQHWQMRPERLTAFREARGLGGATILFVSRLTEENRVDLLLRAGARLKNDFPELRIVIVGDGPAAANLVKLAAHLRLEETVIWVGACYREIQLAPWFMTSDVFVYPANIGLSVLHAFGYGLPVVTSDRMESQNPEVRAVRHMINGVFYRDGDLDNLVLKLSDLLRDRDKLLRMAQAAEHTVAESYGIGNMVREFERAISGLPASA